MVRPKRSDQFVPQEVCIVHAIQRCVRRAFLAGVDSVTGIDYSHRKEIVRRRLETLASVFAIDVLAYAIMSNHFHVVLRNRPDIVDQLSDEEVAEKWLRLYPGERLDISLGQPKIQDIDALSQNGPRIAEIRRRLSDISWFMRALAEPIARLANREDKCTGRFWEGRFKAQRLEDEAALLACAMYVDLNPVRAGLDSEPGRPGFTSAFDRFSKSRNTAPCSHESGTLQDYDGSHEDTNAAVHLAESAEETCPSISKHESSPRDHWLAPIELRNDCLAADPLRSSLGGRASDRGFLNMSAVDYLQLLNWTAANPPAAEKSTMAMEIENQVLSVGLSPLIWRDFVWNYRKYFGKSSCVGSPASMANHANQIGKRYHRGQRRIRECFVNAT